MRFLGFGRKMAAAAVYAVLAGAVAWTDASAQTGGDWPPELQQAIDLHDQAASGEEGVAAEAVPLLQALLESEPGHAVALAYLGSAHTMMARDSSNVINKVRYSNRGLRYLDEAVELAPEDFEVLMVSMNVNKSLPAMFMRGSKADENALALDLIYSAEPSPRRASHMVAVYDHLREQADGTDAAGKWEQKSQEAAKLAATPK